MKTLSLFLLNLISPLVLIAQGTAHTETVTNIVIAEETVLKHEAQETSSKNTVFYADKHLKGVIKLTQGRVYQENMSFKFDESKNAVLIRLPNGKENLITNHDVIELKLEVEGKWVIFTKVEEIEDKNYKGKLFQNIYKSGRFHLVKLTQKEIGVDKNMQLKSIYFLKVSGKSYVEIKLKKKDFVKEISEKKEKIEALFNSLNESNIEDSQIADILYQIEYNNK